MERKKRVNRQRKIILILATIAIACVAVFLVVNRTSQLDRLEMSYLSEIDKKTVQENVRTDFSQTYKIKGYTIYGESLKLYKSASTQSNDDLHGKTVILHNIETQADYSYTFSSGAEEGIHLGNLPQGFYEVYVYDHYVKKRVYFSEETHAATFTTMRRNGEVKNVSLEGATALLEDFDIELDKNYCFITVMDNVPIVNTIDVMIDYDDDDYSYELAKNVKTNLEEKGLRVQLNRKQDETLSYYGKNGRVGKGYKKKAKVFLSLSATDDYSIEAPLIYTSPYTGAGLANAVSLALQEQDVQPYDNTEARSLLEKGVVYDSYISLDDSTYSEYEYYPQLRESGGKVTGAGQLDEAESNRSFKNRYGMYGLYVQFYNSESSSSKKSYKENKDAYAQGITNGILDYFEIEGESE